MTLNNDLSERLLTEKEVASALGVSPRTLQHWRLAGDGPAFAKVGRAVRYPPDSVRAFIAIGIRLSTSDPGKGGGR